MPNFLPAAAATPRSTAPSRTMLYVGTAGWAVPKADAAHVGSGDSGLARYASVFNCAEINSTFKREHRASTFARWADTVPPGFRFAVKLPKIITHDKRLVDCAAELTAFVATLAPLGDKLGPLLVQLPPSLQFDAPIATAFFGGLRSQTPAALVCEPRHPTWFSREANDLLTSLEIARVAADPAPVPEAATPGGYRALSYIRLHGSPRVYYSSYGPDELAALAERLPSGDAETWCIFDNTASGAAFGNALLLKQNLEAAR
jgi:uncharacterized protein YecE (DUF72 family)